MQLASEQLRLYSTTQRMRITLLYNITPDERMMYMSRYRYVIKSGLLIIVPCISRGGKNTNILAYLRSNSRRSSYTSPKVSRSSVPKRDRSSSPRQVIASCKMKSGRRKWAKNSVAWRTSRARTARFRQKDDGKSRTKASTTRSRDEHHRNAPSGRINRTAQNRGKKSRENTHDARDRPRESSSRRARSTPASI